MVISVSCPGIPVVQYSVTQSEEGITTILCWSVGAPAAYINYYLRQTLISSGARVPGHFLTGSHSSKKPKRLIITDQDYVEEIYRCVATNELGLTSIYFSPPASPDMRVTQVTDSSFRLEWVVDSTCSLNVTYIIEHTYMSESVSTIEVPESAGQYEVSGLKPYTLHNINITAINNLTSTEPVPVSVLTKATG